MSLRTFAIVMDRFVENPRHPEAFASFVKLFPRFARAVLGPKAVEGSLFWEEVVLEVEGRVITIAISDAAGLGAPGARGAYVRRMLVNAAQDHARRLRAYGGARAAVEPTEAVPNPVEELVAQDDVTAMLQSELSQELRLIAAEDEHATSAVTEAVRTAARAARLPRYRAAFDATWELHTAHVAANQPLHVFLAARANTEGIPLVGQDLVRATNRVQRAISRLKAELAAAAADCAEAEAWRAERLLA
jgi:hypothetical protein